MTETKTHKVTKTAKVPKTNKITETDTITETDKVPKVVFDAEMRQRLWEHRTSTNQDFNNFANFFLLAESIFLATIASLLTNQTIAAGFIVYVLIVMGFILTIVWIIVQSKQRRILKSIKVQCEVCLPEYTESKAIRNESKFRFSNIWLLTYFIPFLFMTAWIIVGVFVFLKV